MGLSLISLGKKNKNRAKFSLSPLVPDVGLTLSGEEEQSFHVCHPYNHFLQLFLGRSSNFLEKVAT